MARGYERDRLARNSELNQLAECQSPPALNCLRDCSEWFGRPIELRPSTKQRKKSRNYYIDLVEKYEQEMHTFEPP